MKRHADRLQLLRNFTDEDRNADGFAATDALSKFMQLREPDHVYNSRNSFDVHTSFLAP